MNNMSSDMIYPGQELILPCWMNDLLCVINREQFEKYKDPCCLSHNNSENEEDVILSADEGKKAEGIAEPIKPRSDSKKSIKTFRSMRLICFFCYFFSFF